MEVVEKSALLYTAFTEEKVLIYYTHINKNKKNFEEKSEV